MNCTEEFRKACEARWVLTHDKVWRFDYYEGVKKHRGQQAANELIAAVNEERKKSGTSIPA